MVAHPNGPQDPRARRRRALRTASAAALAAPLALTAAAADGTEARPASGLAPPAAVAAEGTSDPAGGVDGDAMRHRLQYEASEGGRTSSLRADDATRVQEEDAGDTVGDGGATAQRLPGRAAARSVAGWEVRVDGGLSTEAVEPEEVAPSPEDDGSLGLAR
ncbi:hypothetical protein, partial [Isoptericola sp. NPDC057559]|uniref:hypothetical protein n=1 Tax=Isoptericola sp. NPDC057559 TaxID=3346168 RepID=UPI0036827798